MTTVINETINRMYDLVDILNKASYAYYNGKETIMSDARWDKLYLELLQIEKQTGVVLADSPTQHVGYSVASELAKVHHEFPSLSMDKTKLRDDILAWLGDREGILSWKCDGLTVILTYDNGELVRAETRGDGIIGEDITANARHFGNVNHKILDKRHIVIRGEAVVSFQTFETINSLIKDPEKKYKNPRNMAAGAVRYLNSKDSAASGIRFIPFELTNARQLGINKFSEGLMFIDHLGMHTVEWQSVTKENLVNEIDTHERYFKGPCAPIYPTDGLVLVLEDLYLWEKLGTTKKYPRYAMAFKWADALHDTVLRDIYWSVAKSGQISPVAVFDPIEIEGSTVEKAALHNISMIKALKLGIGDHLKVYKANMIIPQIFEDVEKSDNVKIITKCPICNSYVNRRLGANGRSEFLYCMNVLCPSRDGTQVTE